MNKNLVTILFLTLVTIVIWVGFQIFKVTTSSTIPAPTQKQIQKLDPNLDTSVFDDLETKIK